MVLLVDFHAPLMQEGELVPDETEPELVPPKHILIENVVRDPRVKIFGIPKIGCYLAVPITYNTWLQPGGESRFEVFEKKKYERDVGETEMGQAGSNMTEGIIFFTRFGAA